ncbi:MAG TPA: SDR family oxidoreductase [Oligoflexia bacterium]|nr:SDR family oxidoreductase [Oligoflexia bacterium]
MVLEKNFRKYSHVVVTGGAGFIGSHLCEEYLKQGAAVTAIDNLVTGSFKNIAKLEGTKGFRFIEHDISASMPDVGEFDLMLHFACPASPVDFAKMPLEILKVDSLGTFNSLDAATKAKARYVLASTSEVYGDPLEHPQKESYWGNVNSIGDRSCYDEAKRFAEATTVAYRRKLGTDSGMVRIFNTYGPRMRLNDGRVVPNFCGQALRGEALTVYGDGQQTRSFCYVTDLVDGIIRYAATDRTEPVNLGNPKEFKIRDFADFILKNIPQSNSKIESRPLLHLDDPKQRRPDISRAKEWLGWEPRVSLEEGIKKTIEYFRTVL